MRVFFATSPFFRTSDMKSVHYFESLPGIFLLSEILRSKGCEVEVELNLDVKLTESPQELVQHALQTDFICLSASSFSWGYIRDFLALLTPCSHPPILLGGVHPTLVPDYLVRTSPVDVTVAIGEGEEIIVEYLDYLQGKRERKSIKGICYQEDGQIIKTEKRPLLSTKELGQIPPIRWDDYPENIKFLAVQTSRGCLMNCAFCSIPFRNSWRPFPLDHILTSLELGLKKMSGNGLQPVVFADDCFSPDMTIASNVLEKVTEKFPKVRLNLEARVRDLLKPGFLEKIKDSTTQVIQVGVECGYNDGLRKIRKGLRIEDVEELSIHANKLGIGHRIRYSYIVGFPWEQVEEIKSTIDFAYRIVSKYDGIVQINWWIVVPGNTLFQSIVDKYGIDESIFDHAEWSVSEDIFFQTHPWLTVDLVNYFKEYSNLLKLINAHIPAIGSVFSGPWKIPS
ncbi:MAG: B12-binding domain-containing radical SAM protein [Anaerolineaceae bacterium]